MLSMAVVFMTVHDVGVRIMLGLFATWVMQQLSLSRVF